MARAYDRVNWSFLVEVLSKMSFNNVVVDMIWRLIANNGGVKQGDLLSPALFITAAEVLTLALNQLFFKEDYVNYGLPKWSDKLNHLAYDVTSLKRGCFHLMYLGCPIDEGKTHFTELMRKIRNKLLMWKRKLLSFGGKEMLINNVLQSIPIYLLPILTPPKCVIKDIHRCFEKLPWNSKDVGKAKRWVAWDDICLPKGEGGPDFRHYGICPKLYLQNYGALHYILPISHVPNINMEEVSHIRSEGRWNVDMMADIFNEEVSSHIESMMGDYQMSEEKDKP
ncbi:hypothetical protein H5410_030096 [Solanum commersonii]|uniref:Reverse transcriptase domain-containing protein n=1 Tax=Solanum commersonii TaxID=4109 RepID=A0A9J5YIA5_SOLCO|nr:hypothetical protein H5410_030096 [Solanum commersonii]